MTLDVSLSFCLSLPIHVYHSLTCRQKVAALFTQHRQWAQGLVKATVFLAKRDTGTVIHRTDDVYTVTQLVLQIPVQCCSPLNSQQLLLERGSAMINSSARFCWCLGTVVYYKTAGVPVTIWSGVESVRAPLKHLWVFFLEKCPEQLWEEHMGFGTLVL